MKGDGGNNWSYEVWAASLLLGKLMSSMKIKSPARELAMRMLPLGFFFFFFSCWLPAGTRKWNFAIDDARPTCCHQISFFEREQNF